MSLTKNYFEIFGLPVEFGLDVAGLTPRYRELQKQYHPDRFADKSSLEQREAVQFAAHINAGFDVLKDRVQRARYLLELAGHPIALEKTTVGDTDFLMAQMELREELDEVEELDQIDGLRAEVSEWLDNLSREFAIDYTEQDWIEAADTVRKMQFMAKFLEEVRRVEERLEDAEFDE